MPQALAIAIMTISDSRQLSDDTSGDVLESRIKASGHQLADRKIVKDDIYQIRAQISNWIIDNSVQVIITTGGTGITGRDSTPEAIEPLLDKKIDGFGEIFRSLSYKHIATSTIQSRAFAGIISNKVVFAIPGSTGACKDAWDDIIQHQLNSEFEPCNLVQLLSRLSEH